MNQGGRNSFTRSFSTDEGQSSAHKEGQQHGDVLSAVLVLEACLQRINTRRYRFEGIRLKE